MKNILIHNISYKTSIGAKLLHISFDGTRYFVLLAPEKYDNIYKRIKYYNSKKLY